MSPPRLLAGSLAFVLAAGVSPATAQHFCDLPPTTIVLTGDRLNLSALDSEGHPFAFSWYVTPPEGTVPVKPTATGPTLVLTPTIPGSWSIALVADYQHQAVGGGLWSSETCVTVEATSVIAAIALSSTQIATDESLELSGSESVWAAGAAPVVQWLVDGQPLGACNGGPPPATPADLQCTVPANWLAPGWHTAGLRLTDPSSGQTSLDSADFEVIEIVPLSVDFMWTPFQPDPGQLVHFVADLTPDIDEQDLALVVWNMGDGTVITYTSCPPFFGSCLEWPHTFASDGWYDVSITVETVDESASASYQIEVGDPVAPPVASFTASPAAPHILEPTLLSFDGSCEGSCSWWWDFGDGGHASVQSPTHAWAIPAGYTVTLTVSNEGGNDSIDVPVDVSNCWNPRPPRQSGSCYGGTVFLTAAAGNAWSWSTGATSQTIAPPGAGAYWVNVESGTGCWGHSTSTVVLANCGDPGGDANLDGVVDAGDPAALVPELTDGDGDTVVGAGGGDLTAPGGDVTGDNRLRVDDLLTVLLRLYE